MGAGKTMLAEAMLFKAGALTRLGSITDKTTASDYSDEEKEHQYSINSTFLNCSFAGKELNIIDTPGGVDFVGGQVSGISGCDTVVICVNASKGIEAMARKAWENAEKQGKARVVVVTRMDGDNVNWNEVLSGIQTTFGSKCVPFTLPEGEGSSFSGVSVVIGKNQSEDTEDLRGEITENVVESDDELMEKYLEQGEISIEDMSKTMPLAIAKGTVIPVFAVAAEKDLGVEEFMQAAADFLPNPLQITFKAQKGEGEELEELELTPGEDQPLLAQVFKTISDPHVGKLCFARIFNGKIEAKGTVTVSSTGKGEKVAQLHKHNGEKHSEIPEGVTGDIVTIGKVESLNTGANIYASGNENRLPEINFPNPMVGLAVAPKARGDEQKIGTGLQRLQDEDPTFTAVRDNQTHELVARGMGQVHLDIMLKRLKDRFGVEVSTKPPKIPYLETIGAKAEGHYRHKKQSGGAGQFAEVYIRMWPTERGSGFEFVNSIVGGAISQPFVGSTEKGCRQALEKGPLAGYPIVDIAVEVYDGKEHPVDSKDIAFQTAGRNALYEAMKNAKPTLLEPIVKMEVVFPQQYTGDISGDISGRRGRPSGMETLGDMQMIKADVPLAEVSDYGSTLKAITQGEGFFSLELSHYEPLPSNVAQQVVAKLKAAEAEEEK
jgi:elongation factor G